LLIVRYSIPLQINFPLMQQSLVLLLRWIKLCCILNRIHSVIILHFPAPSHKYLDLDFCKHFPSQILLRSLLGPRLLFQF